MQSELFERNAIAETLHTYTAQKSADDIINQHAKTGTIIDHEDAHFVTTLYNSVEGTWKNAAADKRVEKSDAYDCLIIVYPNNSIRHNAFTI